MSSRPGVLVSVRRPSDGGEPPNQTRAQITVEVRAFWPPIASDTDVLDALQEAYQGAADAIRAKKQQSVPQKVWLQEPSDMSHVGGTQDAAPGE